jgi:hypothetical protein
MHNSLPFINNNRNSLEYNNLNSQVFYDPRPQYNHRYVQPMVLPQTIDYRSNLLAHYSNRISETINTRKNEIRDNYFS